MKYIPFCLLFILWACNNQKNKNPENEKDTTQINKDTTQKQITNSIPANNDSLAGLSKKAAILLQNKYASEWTLLSDSAAKWPRDEYDYFIAPKRKTDPDYPYVARGDFDGDGKEDLAALAIKTKGNQVQLVIFRDYTGANPIVNTWTEDMDISAISKYPKGELNGMNTGKVIMKGDAVNVEYFEKSAFVIYWTGKGFKRAWTGD